MNNNERESVRAIVDEQLMFVISDAYERREVVSTLLPEIIKDVEETADEEFNDSDVSIALSRVLYKKIVGW